MQSDTGQIFSTKKMEEIIEQEPEKEKLFIQLPFQKGDTVEVEGIKFRVEKIRQNPVNRVMLQGIPQI